jgi:hypothetical protein
LVVQRPSWNHPALEHLVGDGSRNSIDKLGAHLWITAQFLDDFLLHRRLRLVFLLPQLLACRLLIFLDDLLGDHVQERILSIGNTGKQQHGRRYKTYKNISSWLSPFPTETFLVYFRISVSLQIHPSLEIYTKT